MYFTSISELKVIGSALIERRAYVEPNLAQRLPVTVTASSEFGGNLKEGLTDDSILTNWYSLGNPGEFVEITFPVEVTVSEIISSNPQARPDGFGTSLLIECTGTFVLLDATRAVLFDSGVVNAPSGGLGADNRFTLAVPTVAGVRHVRYTMASCAGSAWPAGFAEIRVRGTADVTTPAFQLGKKFQALQGREAHSTPIVVNLTDDNGDGLINAADIPDIVVPVEALTNQLRGEIKAISGADGTELFTAGGPDLVSPWSELAAADIDGDGRPEIVAVHSDANHLIAFEHTGAQKWISDANAMPRFGGQFVGGAVSIANLDGAGAPEIIVGASVFDANGRLLADGRTLGGTTGGINLRSAISAVADIDLDGVPEIVAGPTAYRLSGGALSTVWQRSDRPDGYVAIANLDDDPEAEIVNVANGVVYVLNHDGSDYQGWNAPTHAPVPLPGGGMGGAPLIVDVDGDGTPEIGVAAASHFILFNRDGRVRWRSSISDRTSNSTGAVAFDLNGDGQVGDHLPRRVLPSHLPRRRRRAAGEDASGLGNMGRGAGCGRRGQRRPRRHHRLVGLLPAAVIHRHRPHRLQRRRQQVEADAADLESARLSRHQRQRGCDDSRTGDGTLAGADAERVPDERVRPRRIRGRHRQLHVRGLGWRAAVERGNGAHRRAAGKRAPQLHLECRDDGGPWRGLRVSGARCGPGCRRRAVLLTADGAEAG